MGLCFRITRVFVLVYYFNSNIRNESLTYLRGLEIAKLKEEDMPKIYKPLLKAKVYNLLNSLRITVLESNVIGF